MFSCYLLYTLSLCSLFGSQRDPINSFLCSELPTHLSFKVEAKELVMAYGLHTCGPVAAASVPSLPGTLPRAPYAPATGHLGIAQHVQHSSQRAELACLLFSFLWNIPLTSIMDSHSSPLGICSMVTFSAEMSTTTILLENCTPTLPEPLCCFSFLYCTCWHQLY